MNCIAKQAWFLGEFLLNPKEHEERTDVPPTCLDRQGGSPPGACDQRVTKRPWSVRPPWKTEEDFLMKERNDFHFWNVTKLVCDVALARQRCVRCLKCKSEEKFMTENHENDAKIHHFQTCKKQPSREGIGKSSQNGLRWAVFIGFCYELSRVARSEKNHGFGIGRPWSPKCAQKHQISPNSP